jgi:hypothetical protein
MKSFSAVKHHVLSRKPIAPRIHSTYFLAVAGFRIAEEENWSHH